MDTIKGKEIKVGIFIFLCLTLFLISVLLLGGDRYLLKSTLLLRLQMNQVQGIVEGSAVSLSGINIGSVKKIDFTPQGNIEILLRLDQNFSPMITEGSQASVRTQGALGDKYIYIEPGPPQNRPLKEGDLLASDSNEDFLDMIKTKGPELGRITDVFKELQTFTQSLNEGQKTRQIISNLETISLLLKQVLTDTHTTLNDFRGETSQNLKEASHSLASILKKIDQGQGTLGALINDSTINNKILSLLGDSPHNKYLKPLIRESIQNPLPSPLSPSKSEGER